MSTRRWFLLAADETDLWPRADSRPSVHLSATENPPRRSLCDLRLADDPLSAEEAPDDDPERLGEDVEDDLRCEICLVTAMDVSVVATMFNSSNEN